jgi:8-oxo-dGTP pyrophosphatase MutT (NUDIX family)
MNFSRKIFVNDLSLILTTDKNAYLKANPAAKSYTSFTGAQLPHFIAAIELLEGEAAAGAIIDDTEENRLLSTLHKLYHPIDAGGGAVFNEHKELLMIFRRGKWDLPKGKLDKGEDIAHCALREVSEETGLVTLKLEGKVCDTYHIYSQHGEQQVKRTAWYKMQGSVADKLMPQQEEKILDARWISAGDLELYAAQSYEAVRDVMRAAGLNLQQR